MISPPLSARVPTAPLFRLLRERRLAPTLIAEFRVRADSDQPGLGGCGMAMMNPPWQFDLAMRPVLAQLARLLALDDGARCQLDWLVPEAP